MDKNPDAARRSPYKDVTRGDIAKATLDDRKNLSSKKFENKEKAHLSPGEREVIKDAFSLTDPSSHERSD